MQIAIMLKRIDNKYEPLFGGDDLVAIDQYDRGYRDALMRLNDMLQERI